FLGKLEPAQPCAQLQGLLLLCLIERAQRQYGARRATRAEVRQRPGEQGRWRPGGHDQRAAALLHFPQEAEDRLLPIHAADDRLEIIEADALQLRQALEYANTQGGELGEREISSAARFGGRGADRLQKMGLARARRSTNPGRAGDLTPCGTPGVLDGLAVTGRQEAREDRPIRQTH